MTHGLGKKNLWAAECSPSKKQKFTENVCHAGNCTNKPKKNDYSTDKQHCDYFFFFYLHIVLLVQVEILVHPLRKMAEEVRHLQSARSQQRRAAEYQCPPQPGCCRVPQAGAHCVSSAAAAVAL